MSNETQRLAEFVSETNFSDLPSSVVESTRKYLLDTIGCGFVGSKLTWANIVLEYIQEQSGNEEASIFSTSQKATTSQAALANGVMIGGFESEHVGHTSHPAGTVGPALLAISEREGSSGQDFIAAMALGYEVVCRIGEAQTGAVETERGFHNPSANGPFSAAASVGKLFGFDANTQAQAFGIAGSHAGGLVEYAWEGAMTKRLHLGRASQLGLESAILAQKGFTGPTTIIEGPYGYLNAFSPSPKREKLLDGLGQEWLLETLSIKAYPVHMTAQAVVEAIQSFKQSNALDADSIESIHISAPDRLLQKRHLDTAPTSEMGAQYSLPFTVAVAFHRDLDDPLQYDESVLTNPGITSLAGKITWESIGSGSAHGSHGSIGAALDVVIDGARHRIDVETFKGSAANPADFDDVQNKFRRYSRHVLSDNAQNEIIDQVRNLEQLDDVSTLIDRIRAN
jgi:2-methylcitrate dehydratase PrpD